MKQLPLPLEINYRKMWLQKVERLCEERARIPGAPWSPPEFFELWFDRNGPEIQKKMARTVRLCERNWITFRNRD